MNIFVIHFPAVNEIYTSLDNFFKTTSSSSHFRDVLWQKDPHLFNIALTESAFQMADLKFAVDTDFLEAGRGSNV